MNEWQNPFPEGSRYRCHDGKANAQEETRY
jgi:hypothetical protein